MSDTESTDLAQAASGPESQQFMTLSDAVSYIFARSNGLNHETSVTLYQDKLKDKLSEYVLETNDTNTSAENFNAFTQIAGIAVYGEVMQTVKELETAHRIFSASDMRYGTARLSPNPGLFTPPAIHFDAVIQFLDRAQLLFPISMAHRSYGDHIPAELRPIALNMLFRACGIFSTLWGFYCAHEEPRVEEFVSVMQRFTDGTTVFVPAHQISPSFSRVGSIRGWNSIAICIDDELEAHAQDFADSTCSEAQLRGLFISAARNAFSIMATTFADRVENWTWSSTLPFSHAETSYNSAFKKLLSMAKISDENDPSSVPNYSLAVHTASVREQRSAHVSTSGAASSSRSTRISLLSSTRPTKVRRIDGRPVQPISAANSHRPRTANETSSSLTDAEKREKAEKLRIEQEKCRRDMERRERNRQRNREMSSTELKERHLHDFRQLRHQLQGDAPEFYELDDPDSDNEEVMNDADIYRNVDKDIVSMNAISERIDLEVLYEEVLSHCIDPFFKPVPNSLLSIIKDQGHDDNAWLRRFIPANLGMFLLESTRAFDALHYSDHQKVMIHLETHFQLVAALFETFPQMLRTRTPRTIADALHGPRAHPNRFVLSVEKFNQSRLLSNFVCRSYTADHNIRRDLVSAFPGMTICVGRIERPETDDERSSPLMLFMCRYITEDADNLDHDNEDGSQLDNVKVYLMASRYWTSTWNVGHGDVLTLIPFTSFVSITRQFRAAHDVYKLPQPLQQILFGTTNADPRHPLPHRRLPRSRQEYEQSLPPLDSLKSRVDAESLSYIESLPPNVCDSSQQRALITSLAEMGDLQPSSSSMSGIFGPPGTGKSTCICLAIGAILHHSAAGHIGDNFTAKPSLLKNSTHLTFSNDDGVRILVTCPSNQGVDELAAKLKSGIPGKNGETIFPKIVRIGRFNYDYGDLEDISVQKLGLQYDAQVFNVDHPRRNPSKQAQGQLAQEAVVFLATTSTAAGPMLKNIRANFSVVFVDEAAHGSEQDTLCALAAGARQAQMQRLHVVLVGDSHQLKPVYISQHAGVTFLNTFREVYFRIANRPISLTRQFVSMFERLYDRNRCPFSWLTHQYRSHPDMARVCTRFKYADILIHPTDLAAFSKPYNSVNGPVNTFAPLTLIDTRCTLERYELSRGSVNGLHNPLEARLVNSTLFDVYSHRGDSFLTDDIIVTTPYKAQLNYLRQTLSQPGGFLHQYPGVNVKVDTIDSLQGSERSVVIVSLVRSNTKGNIGFLREENRLNVSFTRAKHLLVIIGDFSTLSRSRLVSNLYEDVVQRASGTAINFVFPQASSRDERETAWVNANVLQQ